MMAIALGGRWGRSESDDEAAQSADDTETISEAGSSDSAEAEVVEPSEVRAEEDPWKD